MGGMGGTGNDTGALGGQTSATDPNRFAGSRAAATAGTTQPLDWSALTGLLSAASPAAPAAGASASPLAVNPTATAQGFQHAAYAPTPTNLPHIGAPDKAVAAAAEAPKEFAAPTSFRPIYDAAVDATAKVGGKGAFYSDKNWASNPAAVQEWLQAIADAGGDFRVQDKYYNTVSPGAGMKIYWPGDPARPK